VTPQSVPAFFSHDGSTLSFGMGRRGGLLAENLRPVLGDPGEVIEDAIAQAASSYFGDIEAARLGSPATTPMRPESTRSRG
jgi:hypothetical protein